MKVSIPKRYLTIAIYIIVVVLAIHVGISCINTIPLIYQRLTHILATFADILFPVIIGMIVAYLLWGPTKTIDRFLQKKYIKNKSLSRAISIMISYICLLTLIATLFIGIYYMIGGQLSKNTTIANAARYITDYIENYSLSPDTIAATIKKYHIPFSEQINKNMESILNWLQSFVSSFSTIGLNFIIELGSNIFSFVIGLILSIYFLQSAEYFFALFHKIFFVIFKRSRIGNSIRSGLHIINNTFSNYIRGQLIEALIVGILSSLALLALNIDYALVIGIICGVFNLIPYLGPLIGTILAGVIGLLGGGFWSMLWAVVAMQVIQQLDANVMAPKIVGDSVGLHPAFIIISILIGGDLYGLFGMLIAVPVAASMKAIASEIFKKRYQNSYEEYQKEITKNATDAVSATAPKAPVEHEKEEPVGTH